MKKITALLILFLFTFSISFTGCKDKAKQNSTDNPVNLQISFADSNWDGNNVPKGQQCQKYGGSNPSTPRLMIKGIPSGANVIIMKYSDRSVPIMDYGGHGEIGYRIPKDTKEILIPSIPGHSFNLPKDFIIIEPHQAPEWDKAGAYLPPCSGGKGNAYYVTVSAVFQSNPDRKQFKLLGRGVRDIGKY